MAKSKQGEARIDICVLLSDALHSDQKGEGLPTYQEMRQSIDNHRIKVEKIAERLGIPKEDLEEMESSFEDDLARDYNDSYEYIFTVDTTDPTKFLTQIRDVSDQNPLYKTFLGETYFSHLFLNDKEKVRRFQLAAALGDVDFLNHFYNHYSHLPIPFEESPLHLAIRKPYTYEAAKFLIKKMVSVDVTDFRGQTPLHWAVIYGNFEGVKLLLLNSANTEARDRFYNRPLHYAAEKGDVKIAEILIEAKAKVNSKNYLLKTPLHFAYLNGHEDLANYLLGNGGHEGSLDYKGRIPGEL